MSYVVRCDWRDPSKRNGELGQRCYVIADKKIVRTVNGKQWTAYRCVWHVPADEPKIGTLDISDLTQKEAARILDTRSERSILSRDETLRGF